MPFGMSWTEPPGWFCPIWPLPGCELNVCWPCAGAEKYVPAGCLRHARRPRTHSPHHTCVLGWSEACCLNKRCWCMPSEKHDCEQTACTMLPQLCHDCDRAKAVSRNCKLRTGLPGGKSNVAHRRHAGTGRSQAHSPDLTPSVQHSFGLLKAHFRDVGTACTCPIAQLGIQPPHRYTYSRIVQTPGGMGRHGISYRWVWTHWCIRRHLPRRRRSAIRQLEKVAESICREELPMLILHHQLLVT